MPIQRPASNLVDVSKILESQKLSGFLIGLVLISWFITFFDGLDTNIISFAAPYFGSEYHLSKVQLGNIFSMGLLGTLIGGFIFGYIGDKIGRRPAILLAASGFSVLTMTFAYADSYWSLLALRLISGIPLGGMLPLSWALNIEYAPKKYRATVVTLIMMGYSLGTGLGGPIANKLIPLFGWKALFIFGGVAAAVSTAILFAMLPESIRFLTSKGEATERIRTILKRVAPEEIIPAQVDFVVTDEAGHSKTFKPSLLFKGELSRITPLIWMAYIASSFAVFFIVNWTPLVFESLKYNRADAATAATLNSLFGAVGGVLLMRFTDKRGAIAITIMPIITFILLLIASFVDMSKTNFLLFEAMTAGFLIGGHFGMHSICGLFYPSSYRANGTAWATSMAKIGSVTGPLVGGWVLSTNLPVRHIFAVLAVCPAIFAVCIYLVGRMHSRMLGIEALAAIEESGSLSATRPLSAH
jgi:AAHS family 4-hydroxybenzoate transporter-like MFS transporter